LTAPGFETEPGMCLRWTRQVVISRMAGGRWPCPQGLDAKQALIYIRRNRPDLVAINGSVPGDIIFLTGGSHGPHGHVGIRIYGNVLAENSTVHYHAPRFDARGTRGLRDLDGIITVVRLWS